MLPGVELARRRRLHHHHEIQSRGPQEPSGIRPPPTVQRTTMDESALVARRRLEEKLRRFVGSPPSSSSPSRPAVGGGERLSQGSAGGISRNSVLQRRNSSADLCAVCLDEVVAQQAVTRLPCSHKYHSDCLRPWLAAHSDCPCCRTLVPSLHLLS